MEEIAIFGAGGFGLEVAMLIEQINNARCEWNLIGFFDDALARGLSVNDYSVLGGTEDLNRWPYKLSLAVAIGMPGTKRAVVTKITNPKITYPVLVHPSVILGNLKYLHFGEGALICAGTIVTTNVSIGSHVLLNLACTVGHETELGAFSSFMPACNISGQVKIGEGTFWGTGAKVINNKRIGDNVTVGAGAVVIDDLPDHVTAVGVPARIVR
jgi:sugar O-acyltransferase (sialic acid O-acetyltransferase NeuD family)